MPTAGNSNPEKLDLASRTLDFSKRVIRLVDSLPATRSCDVIGRQLLRSATSVGANYRSAKRARSTAEFLAKLGIVEEEADESAYWLDLLTSATLVVEERLKPLKQEIHEITAMIVSSIRTARNNARR